MTQSASATGIRSIGYIIVFVRDMQRAVRFYRDTLDVAVKFDSPHWTEFALEGTTLALHWAEDLPPAPAPAADPGGKTGVAQEIVFQVEDPVAVREVLVQRGVNVARPKLVHEAGDMVGVSCVFEDPDGNMLSVYGLVPKAAWKE
ncbi:MAG: hypothetical protein EYC70_06885 [Planctomycetota bacterium]|nr:MAG: hypothetical protein EYC70_06885 [Planctomycetota bacterium]